MVNMRMETKRNDLKIPYGIADFKRLRQEKYYYVDKSEYKVLRDVDLVRVEHVAQDDIPL